MGIKEPASKGRMVRKGGETEGKKKTSGGVARLVVTAKIRILRKVWGVPRTGGQGGDQGRL